ncbi:hypothetical protein CY34DRAFT_100590, partial [Suillus luteus UH-Slu-Lm8-n1]
MGLYKTPPASASSTAPSVPTKITFEDIAVSFSEEANRQAVHLKLARPGSEYANAASHSHSASQQAPLVNPTTGVRIHKQNPKGVVCDNPVCTGLPRSMTHDREHCMQQGGGMEGKAPWRNKPTSTPSKKKEVAAAATETNAATNASSSSTETSESPRRHLACAVIEEVDSSLDAFPSSEDIACMTSSMLSTILDTGTTSTLITDREMFWSFAASSSVTVKTANHGSLPTSGRGECVADLTLNDQTFRIRLTNCLHAPALSTPGALVNLLSVGHMLRKGWACNFLPSLRCELSYNGELLGNIPMRGNLFFVD